MLKINHWRLFLANGLCCLVYPFVLYFHGNADPILTTILILSALQFAASDKVEKI